MKVNISDVKKFLKSKGYEWEGYVYDANLSKHRMAIEEDFKGSYKQIRLYVKNAEGEKANVTFIVNPIRFYKIGYHEPMDSFVQYDWSNDWRKQLLETKSGYAAFLTGWVKASKEEANKDYKKSKENLTKLLEEAKTKRNKRIEDLKFVEEMIANSKDNFTL